MLESDELEQLDIDPVHPVPDGLAGLLGLVGGLVTAVDSCYDVALKCGHLRPHTDHLLSESEHVSFIRLELQLRINLTQDLLQVRPVHID